MIQIDSSQGINLKFKVNLTGATFEQLSAWANIEPVGSDISYQVPASIENGVLTLKSNLENITINEKGSIKIKVQHGSNLHDVWESDYQAVEKVQIVLEQIREEKKVEKVVEKPTQSKTEKPIVEKQQPKVAPKVVEKKTEAKKVVEKVVESKEEKIFRFNDFK